MDGEIRTVVGLFRGAPVPLVLHFAVGGMLDFVRRSLGHILCMLHA